jgi:hypothetical protein
MRIDRSGVRPAPRARPARATSEALHRRLCRFNHTRLGPVLPDDAWQASLARDTEHAILEGEMVEAERRLVRARAASAPREPDAFVAWFEALEQDGPGQHDPLFAWLAEEAPYDAMCWFLQQEVAGEAGFDDLVALTQIKMPTRAKLELARNYWDEMGQGHEGGMHGPMLGRLADALHIDPEPDSVVWESLALGNLMIALAVHRRYAYQSLGALGVIELTAPGRAVCVNAGLKRLGIGGDARRYFALHATLDVKHSEAWNREVLGPTVAQHPEVACAIAEGALLRLEAGARCFRRYRRELGFAQRRAAGWIFTPRAGGERRRRSTA